MGLCQRSIQQRFRIDHFVKNTGLHGGSGGHVLTEQYKLRGDVRPQLLSNHLHCTDRKRYADANLGQTGKQWGIRRDAPVAAQCQHEPACNGVR